MEITHGSRMEFKGPPSNHRGGGISFKTLSIGSEGTPENYSLNIARQNEFYSPVHHHNFDQFRFALQGDVSLGPNMLLREGQLSYHPEGTPYGPQKDDADSVKIVLVLQCGGASGQGYMSFDTIARANKELAQYGKFEGGKYHPEDGKVVDGYQALWEHVNKREMVYPKGRYNAPVIMDPESFTWTKLSHKTAGAWKRTLGVFSERELRAEQIKITLDCDGLLVGSAEAIELFFVLSGKGKIESLTENKADVLLPESCIRLSPGTQARVFAEGEEHMILLKFSITLLER